MHVSGVSAGPGNRPRRGSTAFAGGAMELVWTSIDCNATGDHCRLTAG